MATTSGGRRPSRARSNTIACPFRPQEHSKRTLRGDSVEKPNVNDTAQNPTVVGTFDAPRLRKHVPNALQVLFVEPEQMRHMEPPAAIES
jgi:hypothetical protein